jgi:hypothetical protein
VAAVGLFASGSRWDDAGDAVDDFGDGCAGAVDAVTLRAVPGLEVEATGASARSFPPINLQPVSESDRSATGTTLNQTKTIRATAQFTPAPPVSLGVR